MRKRDREREQDREREREVEKERGREGEREEEILRAHMTDHTVYGPLDSSKLTLSLQEREKEREK